MNIKKTHFVFKNLLDYMGDVWEVVDETESDISLEALHEVHQKTVDWLSNNPALPVTKPMVSISVNGIPGSGKSTLINTWVRGLIEDRHMGVHVAVSREGTHNETFKKLLEDFYNIKKDPKADEKEVLKKNALLQEFVLLFFEFTFLRAYIKLMLKWGQNHHFIWKSTWNGEYVLANTKHTREKLKKSPPPNDLYLLMRDVSFDSERIFRDVNLPRDSFEYARIESLSAAIRKVLEAFDMRYDDVYFVMDTSLQQCYNNVVTRSREEEGDGIPIGYLDALKSGFDKMFNTFLNDTTNFTKSVVPVQFKTSVLYSIENLIALLYPFRGFN